MTKSEREALEKQYKEMLPREQQELFEHIEAHFGKKESPKPEAAEDPISIMQRKVWTTPSPALRAALPGLEFLNPGPARMDHDSPQERERMRGNPLFAKSRFPRTPSGKNS